MTRNLPTRNARKARLQAGHSEIKKDSESNEIVGTSDLMAIDLPEETAFLMAMDNLHDKEVKSTVLSCFTDTHEHRKSIMSKAHEKMEARADKANDAYITRKYREQIMNLIAFISLVIAFVYCQQHGATAAQLWALGGLAAGGVSLYAVRWWKNKNTSSKE